MLLYHRQHHRHHNHHHPQHDNDVTWSSSYGRPWSGITCRWLAVTINSATATDHGYDDHDYHDFDDFDDDDDDDDDGGDGG